MIELTSSKNTEIHLPDPQNQAFFFPDWSSIGELRQETWMEAAGRGGRGGGGGTEGVRVRAAMGGASGKFQRDCTDLVPSRAGAAAGGR